MQETEGGGSYCYNCIGNTHLEVDERKEGKFQVRPMARGIGSQMVRGVGPTPTPWSVNVTEIKIMKLKNSETMILMPLSFSVTTSLHCLNSQFTFRQIVLRRF